MPQDRIIRECTRSFSKEGREFTAIYLLAEGEEIEGKGYVIHASLRETRTDGAETESSAVVQLAYLSPDMGKQIFEMIAGADDPVFPVHVPEIIRDQIAATALIEVKQPQ